MKKSLTKLQDSTFKRINDLKKLAAEEWSKVVTSISAREIDDHNALYTAYRDAYLELEKALDHIEKANQFLHDLN